MGKKQQLIEIMSSFHFAFISCNCVNSSHQLDRISKPKNQNQSNHSNQSEQSTTSRGGQSEFEVNKQVNWLRRGKKQASKWWLVLVRIWLIKKVVWVFWTNHLEKKKKTETLSIIRHSTGDCLMSSHYVKSEREKRISPKGGCPSEFDQVMRKILPMRTWRQDKKEKCASL